MSFIVYISIGSNISSGETQINQAFNFLREISSGIVKSEIYSTPSVCCGDDSIYFNAVAKCEIGDITTVNQILKSYEVKAGRIKGSKDVVIDLDIVIADDEIIRTKDFNQEYFQIGYRQIHNIQIS